MTIALVVGILLALAGAAWLAWKRGGLGKSGNASAGSSADPTVRVPVIFSPSGVNRGVMGSDGDPTLPGDQAYQAWRKTSEGMRGYRDVPMSAIRHVWPSATIDGGFVYVSRSASREGGQGHPVLVVREVHRIPGPLGIGVTWRFVAPAWEVSSSGNQAAYVVGVVLVAGATVAGTVLGGPAGGAAAGTVAGAVAEQIV